MKCNCENCKLKNIFYSALNTEELDNYCSTKEERNIKTKEVIIKQGDPINEFIYLKEGLVKLSRDTEHGNQIIAIGIPFDFVSLLSIFGDTHYSYSVTAISDSVVCVIQLNDIKKLILENGNFSLSLIRTLNKSTDKILFNYLDISQKRLYGRIAHVLLYFSEIFNTTEFELPISRKEISQLISMSIENVIRTISQMRKDNIINAYGKRIMILDMARLKHIRDHS